MINDLQTDDGIPEQFRCGCGEAMKVNLDLDCSLIGCPVCGSQVHFETVLDAEEAVDWLSHYWLARGRKDYAGIEGARK